MSEMCCPVCKSLNHQSFWFWEKEDKLMRMWAMDTRVHFSICRECALIFQDPLVPSLSSEDWGFGDWGEQSDSQLLPKEPIEWLRQFPRRGKQPARALEIYSKTSRFHDMLKNEGWDITAIPVNSLLSPPENGSDPLPPDLLDGEKYDLIFCFDVLDRVPHPIDILNRLHACLKSDGGLFVETFNPYVAPRNKKICLSNDNPCIFSFQTLIYALYKAGFSNQAAELCGKCRCFCTKIDPTPEADASKLVPNTYWSQLLYRFERNYSWAWVNGFLDRYLKQVQYQPNSLNQTRDLLRQRGEDLVLIRDVCGAVLLFAQEIDTVRQTLSSDWSLTMHRIFEILGKDYALYDLLQTGSPMPELGTLPDVERYFFSEKLIYMTTTDYFERFFSQDDAKRLCQSIVQSAEVVCKTLSSFL